MYRSERFVGSFGSRNRKRGLEISKSQRLLFLLNLVTLRSGHISILGLGLYPLLSKTGIHLILGIIATTDSLVHETYGVAFFEGGDNVFARHSVLVMQRGMHFESD